MGAITRGLANNITTAGRIAASGVNDATVSAITSLAIGATDNTYHLVESQTVSSDATISFTSGLDSTYDAYCFKFYDIHSSADDADLTFQGSTDSGSNYNTTMTTTFFQAFHFEDDSSTSLSYNTSFDQAQATGFQLFSHSLGTDNDQATNGELWIYRPDSTTFVKNFRSRMSLHHANDTSNDLFTAGYMNTTSAVNAIQFKMTSGNIDSGIIKLFGVRDVGVSGI
jgi:hypothetical protein